MAKKIFFGVLLFVAGIGLALFVFGTSTQKAIVPTSSVIAPDQSSSLSAEASQIDRATSTEEDPFLSPLERASERVTKKPFGIFITPKTSPVQPERFSGYHTGVDFETFPDEASLDVAVRTICDGKLVMKKTASGYGGVAVESCILKGNPITVVYGHLALASITAKTGDILKRGEMLGTLGKGYSVETDGERKHLHLGVHRGTSVIILGYVTSKSDLSGWVDPFFFFSAK